MDRGGGWRATVHGVGKSWTQLSNADNNSRNKGLFDSLRTLVLESHKLLETLLFESISTRIKQGIPRWSRD